MRYFILLGLAFIAIVGSFLFVGSVIERGRTKRAMRQALKKAKQSRNAVWDEAKNVGDLVALYMQMVARHGPESHEARAFRFGTDSRLMKELHSDNAAMQAFEQQADIIDETYKLMKA